MVLPALVLWIIVPALHVRMALPALLVPPRIAVAALLVTMVSTAHSSTARPIHAPMVVLALLVLLVTRVRAVLVTTE